MLLYIGFAVLETGITFWIRISKSFENYEIKEESWLYDNNNLIEKMDIYIYIFIICIYH